LLPLHVGGVVGACLLLAEEFVEGGGKLRYVRVLDEDEAGADLG
jgi:hypothetical protein